MRVENDDASKCRLFVVGIVFCDVANRGIMYVPERLMRIHSGTRRKR